tara:strand:- start:30327 stop:31706 length:1380 start_codon:yes stop_codon:yes gene_type:complete
MDQILGLVSGKTFNDESWNTRTTRRKIFHTYPQGNFPLTGLLSMAETDVADSPKFGWQEKDRVEPETTIAEKGGGGAPICDTTTETPKASPTTIAAGDLFRLQVADKSIFQAKHTVYVESLPTSTGIVDLLCIVVSVVSAYEAIEVRALEPAAAILNTTNLITGGTAGPIGAQVSIIGNANAEGGSSGDSGIFLPPYEVENYTQIFKNPFSATGTAIKVPTDYDKSGAYREIAQDNATEHMTLIEKAFWFGPKTLEYVVEDSETVPLRTTGGVEHFLKEYEKAAAVYRGASSAALTLNTEEDKRIIRPTAGALTTTFFEQDLMERLFRMASSGEKLCVCGSGFLGAVNAAIKAGLTENKGMKSETVYGMNVTVWETPFGTVYFKTHPLFNNSAFRRYDAFFLDMGHIKYRPLKDRDTKRYKNRQANNQDRRKDEWLTEAGLEFRHPQAHMLIKNCRSFT